MIRKEPCALALLLAACASAPPPAPDDLVLGDRLVARCVHGYDPARHAATCKVFHHLYAPDGRLLTSGGDGEFPHHRGLFVGWNQLRVSGRTCDFWHCRSGESQQLVDLRADAAAGTQTAVLDWRRGDGVVLLQERRTLAAVVLGPGRLRVTEDCAFTARLPLRLDGDPQHAGLQFRALAAFEAKDGPKVRYLRPAGAGGGDDDVWTGCDWIAAVLPLPDGPVTVLRVEAVDNPGPVRWSTRAYGRFGATFTRDLAVGQTLAVRIDWVLALGELDAATCAGLAAECRAARG